MNQTQNSRDIIAGKKTNQTKQDSQQQQQITKYQQRGQCRTKKKLVN